MSEVSLLDELWSEQSLWSRTANRLKRRIGLARGAALGVTVGIALLAACAATLSSGYPTTARALAASAALCAALLPLLRPSWSGRALQDWTRARSVSEGLKSEIYLFLAQVEDYRGKDGPVRLRSKTDAMRLDAADLRRHQRTIQPVERPLPPVSDPESYFDVRVRDEIEHYYAPRASALGQQLRRFRVVEVGLTLAAAALGVVSAVRGGADVAPWIAVVTTVSAAVGVHVAAARYEYQQLEYLRTAERLRQIRTEAATASSRRQLEELVRAAEGVISIENRAWMAKLAEEPPDQPAGT